MPQLDSSTYLSQIFWLILTFGVLYWLLRRKALPQVSEVLEARQDRIAADLDRAATLRPRPRRPSRKQEEVVAQAQARAQAQIKELHDRLAADAAKRQAALDADLACEAAARRKPGSSAAREAALAEGARRGGRGGTGGDRAPGRSRRWPARRPKPPSIGRAGGRVTCMHEPESGPGRWR